LLNPPDAMKKIVVEDLTAVGFPGGRLFFGVGSPGLAAVVSLETFLVRRGPDGGVPGVLCVDTGDIFFDGRGDFLPMIAAVGGKEDGAGLPYYPADLGGGRRARGEIGGDAALLRGPGMTGVETICDLTAGPNALAFMTTCSYPEIMPMVRSHVSTN
jgi:hypothetical protein